MKHKCNTKNGLSKFFTMAVLTRGHFNSIIARIDALENNSMFSVSDNTKSSLSAFLDLNFYMLGKSKTAIFKGISITSSLNIYSGNVLSRCSSQIWFEDIINSHSFNGSILPRVYFLIQSVVFWRYSK